MSGGDVPWGPPPAVPQEQGTLQCCFEVASEDGFSSAAVRRDATSRASCCTGSSEEESSVQPWQKGVLEARTPAVWMHCQVKRVDIKSPTPLELHQTQWDQLMSRRSCSDCQMALSPSVAPVLGLLPLWWPFSLPWGLFNLIPASHESGGSCRH